MAIASDNFTARAELLTSRNIPVVPVAPGEKACRFSNWPTLATTSTTQIAAWGVTEDYNTAAVCLPGGICVLDADSDTLTARINREMPDTFTVLSGGKRLPHFYFRQTDRSRALGNRKAEKLFDFQQNRKYVVGPGSRLSNGNTYDVVRDSEIAPIPDWLCDWIEQNSVVEKKFFGESPEVSEKFDYDAFFATMEHYGIDGDFNGNWFVTSVCPVACRKHEQSTQTGFYFDGTHLGFCCFASGCDGSRMSIGQVLAHLNKTHAPYPGVIWPEEECMVLDGIIYPPDLWRWVKTGFEAAAKKQFGIATATDGTQKTFRGPRSENAGAAFDFVLEPRAGETDGLFPLGEISLVGGASGGGKTTLMLDWLEKQARGEFVLGRITRGRSHISLLADRGTNALRRTAERMRLDLDNLSYALLKSGGSVINRIDEAIVKAGVPEVVFVEGADMLTGDPSNPELVGRFLDDLGALAEHYHIAVIGSIGSPKMTAKNGYVSTRDKIIGSTIWGRKVETIIYLNRESGKETDDVTVMTVLPRNAAPEEHRLKLVGGRLHVINPAAQEAAMMTKNEQALHEWIADQDSFTRAQCKAKFTNMNGTKLTERLDGFVKSGIIKQKTKGTRVWYEVTANLVAAQATA